MPPSICRRSGVLLHLTSLPGPFGSGDMGESAYHFIDWLVAASQRLWQVLPLSGIGPGNSPYMSPSAFAGNELLIDLKALLHQGWLTESEIMPDQRFSHERVDFSIAHPFRMARLRLAAQRYFATPKKDPSFTTFCVENKAWLDDYALFMALDQHYGHDGKSWQDWPQALARRSKEALKEAEKAHIDECNFWKFCQWQFSVQWSLLKHYANTRDIAIIGDVPIFVSPHSADVWANQDLFDLDADGRPHTVAGVPPDYFSATGQHWGNPLYKWPEHKRTGYQWWIERMQMAFKLCDIVRIDHFRGFEAYWEIPAQEKTAINGKWRKGPGLDFFKSLFKALNHDNDAKIGASKIIAEDLGIITKEVDALRRSMGLPGMRILQFAFDGKSDNWYLPHNFEANTVVYTGTHDNDTAQGWWSSIPTHEQDYVKRYLGVAGNAIHWDLIRVASSSVAAMSIIPMQDVLGLDAAHRMNRPSQSQGAWEWRFTWDQVQYWQAGALSELTHLHGRAKTSEESSEGISLKMD